MTKQAPQCYCQKIIFTIKKISVCYLSLIITLSTTASPDIVSSNKHSRCLECCLTCIYPRFILIFFMFLFLNLETKSIHFVKSSPKCMLILLSTNQSHVLQKSSFLWTFMNHWHREKNHTWQLVTCDMSLVLQVIIACCRVNNSKIWGLRKISTMFVKLTCDNYFLSNTEMHFICQV